MHGGNFLEQNGSLDGAALRHLFMNHRWAKSAVVIAGWGFLGLLLSLEVYFNNRASMPWQKQLDFVDMAIPQFGRAVMWALMAPLILKLRERLPLSRGRWLGGMAFHVGMSFTVMATYYLGRILSYTLLSDEKMVAEFWTIAAKSFYGRNIIDMAFYWAVIAYGYSLEIHERYKNEEIKSAQLEARLVETELKALREQLRPHFLFNTMNTIAVLVREGKNDEAVTLLARLSSLLRMSLDPARTHEVTVRDEMNFLADYIDIQKARFSDRLSVSVEIEPAAMDARIPNLLLQPLVENAIIHGVAAKSGPGHVQVKGRIEGENLHLQVCDDGPGLSAGKATRQGIGLANTRERIAKIYGARGRITLKSDPGCGVAVEIVLPRRV
jgi:two-component system LytT family sensor kinase